MRPLRMSSFYRALHRPQQIMGGERELMLLSMLLAGVLIIAAMNFIAATIGILLWVIAVHVLRRMAKIDPILSQTYSRQLKYRKYYPAYSTPFRVAQSKRPL